MPGQAWNAKRIYRLSGCGAMSLRRLYRFYAQYASVAYVDSGHWPRAARPPNPPLCSRAPYKQTWQRKRTGRRRPRRDTANSFCEMCPYRLIRYQNYYIRADSAILTSYAAISQGVRLCRQICSCGPGGRDDWSRNPGASHEPLPCKRPPASRLAGGVSDYRTSSRSLTSMPINTTPPATLIIP